MRLRSGALPFFFVTVKPTRIGPSSSRRRACTTKAALLTRAPLATARKSARCLNRSMIGISGKPGSGAQTLAAPGAASGEDLAAAGGRQAGTETVTTLAHQFAGLISPLHGSCSADPAIMPDNEVSPLTAGPKWAICGLS